MSTRRNLKATAVDATSVDTAERAGISRRDLITVSAIGAGGALVVGVPLLKGIAFSNPADAALTAGQDFGVYITIGTDESVTLTCPGAEMGQGISTALPMIIAEELMVDWAKVKVRLADADPAYNRPTSKTALGTSQSTGGSNSVRGYHDYLRQTGADARQRLLVAAQQSNPTIALSDLQAVNGTVVQISTGATVATYGQLAPTAATVTLPALTPWVQPPYRYIGKPMARLDIPAKVNGSAQYGIDVRLPNMLYASVVQSPKVGQTPTVNTTTLPAGVVAIVPVPGIAVFDPSTPAPTALGPTMGVAVVTSTTTWQAVKAARALKITWTDAPYTASIDSKQMLARAQSLMSTGTVRTVNTTLGDANSALTAAPAGQRFTQTYFAPYIYHSVMEPQNTTVCVTDTLVEIWSPTQSHTKAVQAVKDIYTAKGLTAPAIKLHTTYLGGGFGRRLEIDYVRQAVIVAMDPACKGKPVKLVWSREEDMTHDVYRPSSLTQLDAVVDATGLVTAFKTRSVYPSKTFQNTGALPTSNGGVEGSAVDGLHNALYLYPNRLCEWVVDPSQVPVGSWRSVGNSQNCYFIESFLDEICLATGQDQIAFRKRLLQSGTMTVNQQRALTVLDTLATQSSWSTPPASGRQRGVALSMSFGDTITGEVVEVSGSMATGFKVHSVTVVIDPGMVINPDTVRAQVQSAVIQGLSVALWNDMPFENGAPMRRNFDLYRMMRLREAPVINTTIIESKLTNPAIGMGGVGEPGLPPAAPALVNAIARLTGTRVRSLPVFPQPLPPTISGFTPASGGAGTVVTITGAHFTGTSTVTFNGKAAASFTVVSDTQITATAPAGVTTGPIRITTAVGTDHPQSATSATSFTVNVVVPAPTVTSLTPTSGNVGTAVTIAGTGFTGATAVSFNGIAATFTAVSDTSITTTVPTGATSGAVSVTSAGGTASSGTFTVTVPVIAPTITSFSPTSGLVGTTVTINGTGLSGTNAVTFNGVAATGITIVSDTQIKAPVPAGATTGAIAVTTNGGTATTATPFTVLVAPTITGFSPTSGAPGTTVTVNGTAFTGATAVKFNGVAASYTVVSATQITATVPSTATTGKVTVTTAGGTATSATSFSVTASTLAPKVTSFTPSSGGIGTAVTVTGSNFTGATSVKLGTVSVPFAVISSTTIVFGLPSGTTTNKVTVTNPYGSGSSSGTFSPATTLAAPGTPTFSPTSGSITQGTTITVSATNAGAATSLKLGTQTLTFTVKSASALTFRVPAGAVSGSKITLTTAGGTKTSSGGLTVTA